MHEDLMESIIKLMRDGEGSLFDILEHSVVEALRDYNAASFTSTDELLNYLEAGLHLGQDLAPGESGTLPDGRKVHGAGIHSSMQSLAVRQENSNDLLPPERTHIIASYVNSTHPNMSSWALRALIENDRKKHKKYGKGKGHKTLSKYMEELPGDTKQEERVHLLLDMLFPPTDRNIKLAEHVLTKAVIPYYKDCDSAKKHKVLEKVRKIAVTSSNSNKFKDFLFRIIPKFASPEADETLTNMTLTLITEWGKMDYSRDESKIFSLLNVLSEDGRESVLKEIAFNIVNKVEDDPSNPRVGKALADAALQHLDSTEDFVSLAANGFFPSEESGINLADKLAEEAGNISTQVNNRSYLILSMPVAYAAMEAVIRILHHEPYSSDSKKDMLAALSARNILSDMQAAAMNDKSLDFSRLSALVKDIYGTPEATPISYVERIAVSEYKNRKQM